MKKILINLNELKPGTTTFDITSTDEELELENIEFKLSSPIITKIKIYKNRSNYEMEIKSNFKLILICSRCLSEFEKDFEEINNYYLKQGFEKSKEENTFSDEGAYTIFLSEEHIDIAPLIREQVILSLPMKPLCSDNCKLPSYKSNDNEIEERWKKLLELKNKLSK